MTGIFGSLDIDEIPENPFGLPEATYNGFVAKIDTRLTKNDVNKVIFTYEVDDEDDDQDGNNHQEWLTYYPEMTEEDLNTLPKEEKKRVNRDNSYLKKRFLSLNIDPKDVDLDNLEAHEGIIIEFTIVENEWEDKVTKETRTGFNLKDVHAV